MECRDFPDALKALKKERKKAVFGFHQVVLQKAQCGQKKKNYYQNHEGGSGDTVSLGRKLLFSIVHQ